MWPSYPERAGPCRQQVDRGHEVIAAAEASGLVVPLGRAVLLDAPTLLPRG